MGCVRESTSLVQCASPITLKAITNEVENRPFCHDCQHLPTWVDAKQQVNDVIRRPGTVTWRWTQRSVNLKWPNNGLLFKNVLFTFYASKTVVKRSYTTDAQKTEANTWITCRIVGGNTENETKVNVLSTFRAARPYF